MTEAPCDATQQWPAVQWVQSALAVSIRLTLPDGVLLHPSRAPEVTWFDPEPEAACGEEAEHDAGSACAAALPRKLRREFDCQHRHAVVAATPHARAMQQKEVVAAELAEFKAYATAPCARRFLAARGLRVHIPTAHTAATYGFCQRLAHAFYPLHERTAWLVAAMPPHAARVTLSIQLWKALPLPLSRLVAAGVARDDEWAALRHGGEAGRAAASPSDGAANGADQQETKQREKEEEKEEEARDVDGARCLPGAAPGETVVAGPEWARLLEDRALQRQYVRVDYERLEALLRASEVQIVPAGV